MKGLESIHVAIS